MAEKDETELINFVDENIIQFTNGFEIKMNLINY